MSAQRLSLKRGLGEVLLITASILLAFSLEAWWAERGDRARFDEVVLAARAEFAGAQAELARAHAIHEATATTLQELLTLMSPAPRESAMDSLNALWEGVRFTSADVPRGVLANLLASGEISTLPDAELRARLSAWPAALEDHIATEGMYEAALDHLRGLVSARSPIPPGYGAPDYTSAFPARPRAVLSDFAIENALSRSLHLLQIVIGENEALSGAVGETLTDLDAYLASR
jgi:hypothetical protein